MSPSASVGGPGRLLLALVDERHGTFRLEVGANEVGRARSSAITLADRSVSQRHAVLDVQEGSVVVRDLASKNGTFVNDEPASSIEARPGDQIRFGRLSFGLEILDPEDAWLAVTAPEEPASLHNPARAHSTVATHTKTSEVEVHRVRAFINEITEASARGESGVALAALRRELEASSAVLLAVEGPESHQVLATAGSLELDPVALAEISKNSPKGDDGPAYQVLQAGTTSCVVAFRTVGNRRLLLLVPGHWPRGSEGGWLVSTTLAVLSLAATGKASSPSRVDRPSPLVFPEDHVRCPSRRMVRLYENLRAAVESDLPVLVQGETGVGKESIAAILHQSSHRSPGPLVAINCAAIPADLLEAELFGVAKGAATGVAERTGKLESANNGTILLDEIGEMKQDLQVKLLRVLEQGSVEPLGGAARKLDIRFVASTNRNLQEDIASGRFRPDLFYRLSGFVFEIPALRDRKGDIPSLVEHFFLSASKESGRKIKGITYAALKHLSERAWPGNVRELRHAVYRAVHSTPNGGVIDSRQLRSIDSPIQPVGSPDSQPHRPPLGPPLATLESAAISKTLAHFDGNQSATARALGISRAALRRRIAKYALDVDA